MQEVLNVDVFLIHARRCVATNVSIVYLGLPELLSVQSVHWSLAKRATGAKVFVCVQETEVFSWYVTVSHTSSLFCPLCLSAALSPWQQRINVRLEPKKHRYLAFCARVPINARPQTRHFDGHKLPVVLVPFFRRLICFPPQWVRFVDLVVFLRSDWPPTITSVKIEWMQSLPSTWLNLIWVGSGRDQSETWSPRKDVTTGQTEVLRLLLRLWKL